ncbi:hypothetical protein [Streptomyces sp. NPDC092952]|uniref:hypothetical protein n=1 Tax=Streptomyces sp. NPDC092952 TaxID=3366018 RepID=UPI0037F3B992
MGINWGDAPTWAGAVFAAAAAYGALRTMKSQQDQIGEQRRFIADQRKVLVLQEQELKDTALERRQGQARQVSLKVRRVPIEQRVESTPRDVEVLGWRWVADVHNASDAPLYEVRVRTGEQLHDVAFPTDGQRPLGDPRQGPVEVIKIGGLWRFRSEMFHGEYDETAVRPVALFKDESGVEWHLDEHGALSDLGS